MIQNIQQRYFSVIVVMPLKPGNMCNFYPQSAHFGVYRALETHWKSLKYHIFLAVNDTRYRYL